MQYIVKFLKKTSEIKKPGRRTTILHSAKAARLQQGQAGWAEPWMQNFGKDNFIKLGSMRPSATEP